MIKEIINIIPILIIIFLITACGGGGNNSSDSFVPQKWENGEIYYSFLNLSEAKQNKVRYCMDNIEEKSEFSVIFIEVPKEEYKEDSGIVGIFYGTRNYATIGYQIDPFVEFSGALDYGVIKHELLHVIGFFHEFQRIDRDDFLIVNFFNIKENYKHNFEIEENQLINVEEYPYDYESIMNYSPTTFTIDKNIDNIEFHNGMRINMNAYLSFLDIQKIIDIYGK